MARRTLNRLAENKLALSRRFPNGDVCWILSAAGARYLNDVHSIQAVSGGGFSLSNPVHRACIN
jgi:hypothetical protein